MAANVQKPTGSSLSDDVNGTTGRGPWQSTGTLSLSLDPGDSESDAATFRLLPRQQSCCQWKPRDSDAGSLSIITPNYEETREELKRVKIITEKKNKQTKIITEKF